jgi:putative DNA primase/helicase
MTDLDSPGGNDEETEKRLGAALITGDPIIAFDNCIYPLGGERLCQAVTQDKLAVRVLGKSERIVAPNTATIYATGNNLRLVGDLVRRSLLCSLDAHCECPEDRQFESEDPVSMMRRDRPKYVVAALTVLKAFHLAGKPASYENGKPIVPLGSLEEWSNGNKQWRILKTAGQETTISKFDELFV